MLFILQREINRYRTNGLGNTLVALAINVTFFLTWFPFCRLIWPRYMQIRQDYNLEPYIHADVWLFIQSIIIFWSSALIFYFIYTGKYQFIEQWRVKDNEDDVWPWESLDLESWRKLFKRSIFFNLLNQVFLSTSFALITEYFQIYAPHSFDIKMLPSLSVFFAQIVFCCVMEDLTFYINHRILHLP